MYVERGNEMWFKGTKRKMECYHGIKGRRKEAVFHEKGKGQRQSKRLQILNNNSVILFHL